MHHQKFNTLRLDWRFTPTPLGLSIQALKNNVLSLHWLTIRTATQATDQKHPLNKPIIKLYQVNPSAGTSTRNNWSGKISEYLEVDGTVQFDHSILACLDFRHKTLS